MWGKRLKNKPDYLFRDREVLKNHVTVVETLKKGVMPNSSSTSRTMSAVVETLKKASSPMFFS